MLVQCPNTFTVASSFLRIDIYLLQANMVNVIDNVNCRCTSINNIKI